jgi:hypothetical protein
MKGRNYLSNLDIEARIILNWFLKTGCDYVDWIHLAQYRDQLRALVITVVNFW